MIISLDEYKSIKNISDTTNDERIKEQIIIIESAITRYCNHDFTLSGFNKVISGSISFESPNVINLVNANSYELTAGDNIRVYGSLKNDNAYYIDSISSTQIIVNNINEIKDENYNRTIMIDLVYYPDRLKNIASDLIEFALDTQINKALKREKIDDYEYEKIDSSGYPLSIMSRLNGDRHLFRNVEGV